MMNLKFQYFGHLMLRTDSSEKTLMLAGVGGEGDDRGWDGWMASPTQWTWVWVNSGSWWWTGRPGLLLSMGFQSVRHDWTTELNWNCGGGGEGDGDLLQKIPLTRCYTQCPQPCNWPPLTHASAQDPWTLMGKAGSVSCVVSAPFSWVLVPKVLSVPAKSVSPALCKFWQLYGGVNGDPLQGGLRHTQVCCTQGPCPCGRPLLTQTSAGDTQTQFCLSLCGVSGSWCVVCLSPLRVSGRSGVWF